MNAPKWEQWDSQTVPSNGTGSGPTNGSLVVDFLSWCEKVRNRSPRTIETYGDGLTSWVSFLGAMDIRSADVSMMEAWITRPRQGRGPKRGNVGAASTQRKETAVLHSFYRWAYERDLTVTDVAKALHGPSVKNANPRPIADDDWVKLWDLRGGLGDSSVAALGLGFFCGLRRHEIMALRSGQITPDRIVDFVRKGGGEDTLAWRDLVEIHQDRLPWLAQGTEAFTEALRALSEQPADQKLLGWARTEKDAMNKRMVAWCRAAGVGHYTPHQLRHSTATNLLRAGMPLHLVSRVLNHSNTNTTMLYVKAGSDEVGSWRRSQHD